MLKKLLLISILTVSCIATKAQSVVKVISNVQPGGLSALLTATEKSSVTKLVLSGSIDATDFKTIRSISLLDSLDISNASIVAYTGTGGPAAANTSYPANELPIQSFVQDTVLKNIMLPTTLTSIGAYAFYFSYHISNISIPASVTSIGAYSFFACEPYVNVDAQNKSYISQNGVLYNASKTEILTYPFSAVGSFVIPSTIKTIKGGAFAYCSNLSGITIPNSVVTIEDYAFDVCDGLQTLTIPASVKSIGHYSFGHCKFNAVYALSSTPPSILATTFGALDFNSCWLLVPVGSASTYRAAVGWKSFKLTSSVGINEVNTASISYYPNPFTNGFVIDGIDNPELLTISDLSGAQVFSALVEPKEFISLEHFSSGIYFARIVTKSGEVVISKLIKD